MSDDSRVETNAGPNPFARDLTTAGAPRYMPGMSEPTIELQRETQSSIELQRAKDGTYYWTIKCYCANDELEKAVAAVHKADLMLRDLYLTGGER